MLNPARNSKTIEIMKGKKMKSETGAFLKSYKFYQGKQFDLFKSQPLKLNKNRKIKNHTAAAIPDSALEVAKSNDRRIILPSVFPRFCEQALSG